MQQIGPQSDFDTDPIYREELRRRTKQEDDILQNFERTSQSRSAQKRKEHDWAVEMKRQSDWGAEYEK